MSNKIKCAICGTEVSMITNTHLKKHGLTVEDYKKEYPNHPVITEELSKKYTERSKKANEQRKGKPRSKDVKEKIKQTKAQQNIIPWNKGIKMSEEYKKQVVQPAIEKREQKYKQEGWHPKKGYVNSEETRRKISESVKEYARKNPEKLKENAKKAQQTLKNNGFYEKKKQEKFEERKNILEEKGYSVIDFNRQKGWILKCNTCNSRFNRTDFNMMHNNMCPNCYIPKHTSKEEKELYNWLKNYLNDSEIIQNDKSLFGNGFEIDILLPRYNLGIEYNGLYWHSQEQGKNKWYHRTKRDKALENNITLIQIFEDEWLYKKEIVKNRILAKLGFSQKTHARNLKVHELSKREALDFLYENHIQGKGYSSIKLGLKDKNENLIAVMTFAKLNRAKGFKNKENIWELNRYCSKGIVNGGASKLFSYFVKNYNPEFVLSYADLRWNFGGLYEKLGFQYLGNTTPGYWYVDGSKRIHRYKLRKGKDDPKHLTEEEIRTSQSYKILWDCGHAKYEWRTN